MVASRTRIQIFALAVGVALAACSSAGGETTPVPTPSPFQAASTSGPDVFTASPDIVSPAFSEGETIPTRHTCEGADLSPALSWSAAPAATLSIALLVDDPDAPGRTFSHWLVFDMPPDANGLAESAAPDASGVTGKNDFGSRKYRGPCPPRGAPHRYRFTVYYLDAMLGLDKEADRDDFLEAADGHIQGQATLAGLFGR